MEEADLLCNRIGIIDKGKIIALGTPTELKSSLNGDIVRLKTKVNDPDLTQLRNLNFVHNVEFISPYLVLKVDDAKRNIPKILKHIDAEYLEFSSPTLNDVFMKLTGRGIKEQAAEGGFMERYIQYDRF
jgi:ABC-2 type transport system ATP-binding protein